MSFDKLDFFDESDNDGSGSGSPGTFDFPFSSGKSVVSANESVGSVSGVDFGDFVPTGIESLGVVVPLVVLVPIGVESKGSRLIGVESKGGRLIKSFWRPKS